MTMLTIQLNKKSWLKKKQNIFLKNQQQNFTSLIFVFNSAYDMKTIT